MSKLPIKIYRRIPPPGTNELLSQRPNNWSYLLEQPLDGPGHGCGQQIYWSKYYLEMLTQIIDREWTGDMDKPVPTLHVMQGLSKWKEKL